jgi:nucleotide-binding universal stress UspA family protein
MGTASSTRPLDAVNLGDHRILVAIDRSPFADVCVAYAISLARALGSQLTLVHVVQPSEHAGLHTDALSWEISRQEARAHLERLQEVAARELGRPVDVRLEQGQPAERIIDVAREIRADLTVLGSHGEGGVTAWNLGSTVQRVIAVARGSVSIVHSAPGAATLPPRRILAALDGSARTECVLPVVARMARAFDAAVVLAHVVAEPLATSVLRGGEDLELARALAGHLEISAKAYLEGLRTSLVHDGTSVRTIVARHPNQRQCILETAQHEQADLIVVAAHGEACDPARPFGSVTEYLLTHSSVPLLVLQDLPEAELRRMTPAVEPAPPLRASHPPESV